MNTVTLGNLLEEVAALTTEERRQLRDAIDVSLGESTLEDEVELSLLETGLLSELKPAPDRSSAYRECEPIEVGGRPVSQTIVEDRR